MKAPVHVTLVLLGCLAAAAIGWSIGKGARQHPIHSDAALSDPPVANEAIDSKEGTLQGDYEKVAEAPVTLRGDRDLGAVFRRLGGQLTTKLGADPASLAVIGELEKDEVVTLLPDLLVKTPLPESLIATALARWAQFEPEAALDWAEQELDRPAFGLASNEIVGAWATHSPRAAIDWLDKRRAVASSQAQHRLRSHLHTVLTVWAQHDPAAALEAVLDPNQSAYGNWFGLGQVAAMDEHRYRMFELVLAIEDEQMREKGLGAMIGGWADNDPAAAAAWLDENGFKDSKTQWAVSQRYQRADPTANLNWLIARATPENKEQAMTTAIAYWVRSDPEAAGKWVEESDLLTDGIASQLSTGWVQRDPNLAIDWALRVEEEDKRRLAIGNVLHQLKYGGRSTRVGEEIDLESFTEATGMNAEELQKLAEEAGEQSRGRF